MSDWQPISSPIGPVAQHLLLDTCTPASLCRHCLPGGCQSLHCFSLSDAVLCAPSQAEADLKAQELAQVKAAYEETKARLRKAEDKVRLIVDRCILHSTLSAAEA